MRENQETENFPNSHHALTGSVKVWGAGEHISLLLPLFSLPSAHPLWGQTRSLKPPPASSLLPEPSLCLTCPPGALRSKVRLFKVTPAKKSCKHYLKANAPQRSSLRYQPENQIQGPRAHAEQHSGAIILSL